MASSGPRPAPDYAARSGVSQSHLCLLRCGFTCVLFSLPSLILSPSLWPSWALCSEATPTAGTVPAAEVMGMAWDVAGGGQPRRRRRERLGGHAPDSPFQGWAARPSRRMCVGDGARARHIRIPPLTIRGEEGWLSRAPPHTGSRPVLRSCRLLRS